MATSASPDNNISAICLGEPWYGAQSDLRIKLPEVAHGCWQGIAGLQVWVAAIDKGLHRAPRIACGVAQVVGISQQPLDDGQHLGAWFGQSLSGACQPE